MASGTVVLLEERITFNLISCHCSLITLQVEVERRVGGNESLLILGDGICDGCSAVAFWVDSKETLSEVGISSKTIRDLIKRL